MEKGDRGEYKEVSEAAAGEKLKPNNRSHQLREKLAQYRECHITPDWLLIYEIDGNELDLYLTRTGIYSDLLG